MEEVTEAQWLEMLPNYASYPNSFRCTLPFLLASVVYHNAWLRANLDARHPLFNSRLYTAGYYQKFADKVLTGNIRCEASKLVATGVLKMRSIVR